MGGTSMEGQFRKIASEERSFSALVSSSCWPAGGMVEVGGIDCSVGWTELESVCGSVSYQINTPMRGKACLVTSSCHLLVRLVCPDVLCAPCPAPPTAICTFLEAGTRCLCFIWGKVWASHDSQTPQQYCLDSWHDATQTMPPRRHHTSIAPHISTPPPTHLQEAERRIKWADANKDLAREFQQHA